MEAIEEFRNGDISILQLLKNYDNKDDMLEDLKYFNIDLSESDRELIEYVYSACYVVIDKYINKKTNCFDTNIVGIYKDYDYAVSEIEKRFKRDLDMFSGGSFSVSHYGNSYYISDNNGMSIKIYLKEKLVLKKDKGE